MTSLMFLLQTATAGPTIGIGLGGLMVLPEDRSFGKNGKPTCENFSLYSVRGDGNAVSILDPVPVGGDEVPPRWMLADGGIETTCVEDESSSGIGGGLRIAVPIRFRLTETATLRVSMDLDFASISKGSYVEYTVRYDEYESATNAPDLNQPANEVDPAGEVKNKWARHNQPNRFLGVSSVSAGLRVLVGPEFALKPDAITPYLGASVGVAAQYTYNGLGHNTNLEGWESSVPLDYRTDGKGCSVDRGASLEETYGAACQDIAHTKFVPLAEIHAGVMNTGEGLPFFVEAGYSVGLVSAQKSQIWDNGADAGPNAVPAGTAEVRILPYHYRPISLTAGLMFKL